MQRQKTRKVLTRTAALFALILIGAGCHTSTGEAYEFPEGTQLLMLAPQSDGTSLVVDEHDRFLPGAESMVQVGDANQGLSRSLNNMQGDARPEADLVFKSQPLAKDYYIDLSLGIGGTLYLTNDLGQSAAGMGIESGKLRTTLFVDGQFAGGYEWIHTAQTSQAEWNPINIWFRPEVSDLPAGSVVEVHVTRISGLLDLSLGTGGEVASNLQVPFFPFDPLSGAIFLEDGKLVRGLTADGGNATSGSERAAVKDAVRTFMDSEEFDALPPGMYVVRAAPEETGHGAGGLALAGLAALPAVGLVGLGGRLRGRGIVAAVMVVAVAFAGCAGGGGDKDDTEDDEGGVHQPSVDERHEDTNETTEATTGIIRGLVHDQIGVPIEGAHISFISTNLFTQTDEEGRFEFRNVPVGSYTMRIDAKDFKSLERSIQVQDGKVTQLQVKLAPPESRRGDALQHVHDEWRGQERRKLEDAITIEPDTQFYTLGQDLGAANYCGPLYGQENGVLTTGNTHGIDDDSPCRYEVPRDYDERVLPGAVTLEVRLTWTDGPPEMGFAYQNNIRPSTTYSEYLPRPPGEPFFIQFFPNEADPGHQEFSNWKFHVFAPKGDLIAPQSEAYWEMGDITVETFIHKGIIPFEPAHQDRWGENDRLVLQDGSDDDQFFTCTNNCEEGPDGWSYSTADGSSWPVLKGGWVPHGTARIEGTMTVIPYSSNGYEIPTHILKEYAVGYTAADVHPDEVAEGMQVADFEVDGNKVHFTIEPDGKELDQWYQTSSNWRFYILAKSPVHPYSYQTDFALDAVAIKDPGYVPPGAQAG